MTFLYLYSTSDVEIGQNSSWGLLKTTVSFVQLSLCNNFISNILVSIIQIWCWFPVVAPQGGMDWRTCPQQIPKVGKNFQRKIA